MIRLEIPIPEAKIRELKVGDTVLLTGIVVTARDAGHKLMVEERPQFLDDLLREGVIYHCGPVAIKSGGAWKILAAGPTTSIREEPYEAGIIKNFRPAAIMGKGGMGAKTLDALKEFGCVYLHATGGAAAYLADCINGVKDVFFLDEFGQPEAMWVFEVTDFPAIVTMDSFGKSLHEELKILSRKNLEKLINLKTKPD